jgi:hypothetical protein
MKNLENLLLALAIALSFLSLGLIIAYVFSSGNTAGQIGDALDLTIPLLLTLGTIGMITSNSND